MYLCAEAELLPSFLWVGREGVCREVPRLCAQCIHMESHGVSCWLSLRTIRQVTFQLYQVPLQDNESHLGLDVS